MFEKVNPDHPDKIADRIAGAVVDLAYTKQSTPKAAVEVLIGHGECFVIAETSEHFETEEIESIVNRIVKNPIRTRYLEVPQDIHLSENQKGTIRCGDNGIFKGMPLTFEQRLLSTIARDIYHDFPCDGKYIVDGEKIVICQSNAKADEIRRSYPQAIINPLGDWTGGPDVDSGATNRKLGSDMADSVTGGGLHGKDLSKADVSVNIYAWLEAQRTGAPVEFSCAIGDEFVGGKPFVEIVDIARRYINDIGGFEKFAEWGLV